MNKQRKWGWAVLAMAMVVSLAPRARATPIKPDLKKLLSDPPPKTEPYVPARAGWNGPEVSPVPPNPDLLFLTQRPPVWEEIASVAIPDARLVVLLALAIVLMRALRERERKEEDKSTRMIPFPATQERKAA